MEGEPVAESLLNTLTGLKFVNDKSTLNGLIIEISKYAEFLSTMINKEKIDHILYGKIIEALFQILENNVILLEERELLLHFEKILILENAHFILHHELLIAILNFLKELENNSLKLFIIGIVEKVLKSDSLSSSLISACKRTEFITSIEEEEHEGIFKKYVQLLVSTPSRISNEFKGQTPKTFSVHNFSNIMAFQLIRVALSYNENRHTEFNMQRFSFLVSKMMISLGCENFEELMKIFICWSIERNEDCPMNGFMPGMLEFLDENSIEPIAVLLLKNIRYSGTVKMVFGNVIEKHIWKFILTTKIPLHSFYKEDRLIINLIDYLSSTSCRKEILLEIIMKLLDVWGNKSALNHTLLAQHEYITKILLYSIKTVQVALTTCEKNAIRDSLISGTKVHLDSVQVELRAIGMITSQLLMNLLNETDIAKLKYDYNLLPHNGKYFVDQLNKFWIDNNSTLNTTNIECSEVKSSELINNLRTRIDAVSSNGAPKMIKSRYTPEEIVHIERNIKKKDELMDVGKVEEMADIMNESDLDSDDDLVPYDSSNDTKNGGTNLTTTVIYLRDLKEILSDANGDTKPELFVAALQSSESIIISQLANDDESFALELLAIISKLRKKTHVDNFYDLKLKSCVAITKIFPKKSAKFLCDEFHANVGVHSINDRLFFLNVLNQSIKELSELQSVLGKNELNSNAGQRENGYNRKKTRISKPISLLFDKKIGSISETLYDDNFEISGELDDNDIDDNTEFLAQRIKSNTRIFAHQSELKLSKPNNLNDVLPHFFYPLFYGIYRSGTGCLSNVPMYFNDSDNILLVNYLHALSTIMIAAENCTIASNIGRDILELAWHLRYHEVAKVRCCVIENVAAVMIAVSKEHFTQEILELLVEFKFWLDELCEDSVRGDPDSVCRSKGRNLSDLMNSILVPILNIF
uniref:Telomere length regulation protein conserved domain-containing protein n=1 Tax=Bracon brevicornis TaxID=1563983 RepID=A0A6V7JG60_9HYME